MRCTATDGSRATSAVSAGRVVNIAAVWALWPYRRTAVGRTGWVVNAVRFLAVPALFVGLVACASTITGSGSSSRVPSSHAPTTATASSASATDTAPRRPVTPTASSTVAGPLRTVTVSTTISGKTYVIKVWAERKDATCAEHAYGTPVINFLRAHACTGLDRLLATTAINGRAVGFAESRLGFVGTADAVYRTASDFRKLVTEDGTGNINDLLRDGARLPNGPTVVPSPSAFSALGQDAGVTIDELWYLAGSTPVNDPPLVQMAQDIYLQFG